MDYCRSLLDRILEYKFKEYDESYMPAYRRVLETYYIEKGKLTPQARGRIQRIEDKVNRYRYK